MFVKQRYAVTFWWVTCESESQGTQKKINKYFLWSGECCGKTTQLLNASNRQFSSMISSGLLENTVYVMSVQ